MYACRSGWTMDERRTIMDKEVSALPKGIEGMLGTEAAMDYPICPRERQGNR